MRSNLDKTTKNDKAGHGSKRIWAKLTWYDAIPIEHVYYQRMNGKLQANHEKLLVHSYNPWVTTADTTPTLWGPD